MKQIIEAISKVYGEIGYVQKTKKKGGVTYAYVGEAELINKLRPLFIEHGLIMWPSKSHVAAVENYTTKNGATMNKVVSEYEYTIAHTSGETITVAAVGEGADVGDKSSPKAATIALKYALRQVLLLETGDDPDDTIVPERANISPEEQKKINMMAWAEKQAKNVPQMDDEQFIAWNEKQDWPKLKEAYPEAYTVIYTEVKKREKNLAAE